MGHVLNLDRPRSDTEQTCELRQRADSLQSAVDGSRCQVPGRKRVTVAEMLRLAAEPRYSNAVRNVAMLRVMFDLALRVSEVRQLDVAEGPGFERASKIRGR